MTGGAACALGPAEFQGRPCFQWPQHDLFVRFDATVASIKQAHEQPDKMVGGGVVGGAAAAAAAAAAAHPPTVDCCRLGSVKLCIKNHMLEYVGHSSVMPSPDVQRYEDESIQKARHEPGASCSSNRGQLSASFS